VKNLNFPDNFFDGYWSLGVIEHFYEGYKEILKEMERIVKTKGYLFLTFPYMSPLRKLKAKLNLYKKFDKQNINLENFYQFMLNHQRVIKDLENYNFNLILKYPFDTTKGIKDEISCLKPILQKIYDSQNVFARGVRFLLSLLFSKLASHNILLICQNEK